MLLILNSCRFMPLKRIVRFVFGRENKFLTRTIFNFFLNPKLSQKFVHIKFRRIFLFEILFWHLVVAYSEAQTSNLWNRSPKDNRTFEEKTFGFIDAKNQFISSSLLHPRSFMNILVVSFLNKRIFLVFFFFFFMRRNF